MSNLSSIHLSSLEWLVAVVDFSSSFLAATSGSDSSASVTSVEYLSTAANSFRIPSFLTTVDFSLGEVELVVVFPVLPDGKI